MASENEAQIYEEALAEAHSKYTIAKRKATESYNKAIMNINSELDEDVQVAYNAKQERAAFKAAC